MSNTGKRFIRIKKGSKDYSLVNKIAEPSPPVRDKLDDKEGYEEQEVYRVEQLMARGVTRPNLLMAALQITDRRKLTKYINRVYARWEMSDTLQNHNRARGESLFKLSEMEMTAWQQLSNVADGDHSAIQGYLAILLKIQEHRNSLSGLTPKVIANLGVTSRADDVVVRSSEHSRLVAIASKALQLLDERSVTVAD